MKLSVYLDDGRVCEYEIDDSMKAREMAARIIDSGLRAHVGNCVEWYPPHRISKVKFPSEGTTKYLNSWRET